MDSHNDNQEEQLNKLREILFKKESQELEKLRALIDTPDELSIKVSPIVEKRITKIKENFPIEFGTVVEKEIEQKLQNSQEELINILTPYFGKLIQQYVKYNIDQLQKNIQQSIDEKLSFFSRFKKNKAPIVNLFQLEEVLLIEKHSGILKGDASDEKSHIDRDIIAGMLTAIKGFVEDAFEQKNKELEFIEYQDYNIFLHSLDKHYFAFIGSGHMGPSNKELILTKVFDFMEQNPILINDHTFEKISNLLNNTFFKTTIND